MVDHLAEREKRWVALTSVLAAVGITALKLGVGLWTGSLGILAEAAHSGLDLVAAVMTLLAVRMAGKPADKDHPYGHGKIENLSALFETLLLAGTCVWILWEAISRLLYDQRQVTVNVWAFLVIILSIIVDYSRSRALFRAAKKYNSQALEADALHFSTDIWSSAAVLVGLVCVLVAQRVPALAALHHADAVAAIVVALVVVWVIVRMGMKTIHALLDTAPSGMQSRIVSAVEALPGIIDCHQVRVRSSGPHLFVDVHVLVDGEQSLKSAHDLTELVERTIQELAPDADVTVHPEPQVDVQASVPTPS